LVYKHYIVSFLFNSLQILFLFKMFLFFFQRDAFLRHDSWWEWMRINILYLFNIQVLLVSLLASLPLFSIHTYFMITNTTTWEKFSRHNITYFRALKDSSINPYHLSYLKNVFQFCCINREETWENVYADFIKNSNGIEMRNLSAENESW
jgi:hypothetical protein